MPAARNFIKYVLNYSPRYIAFALTGSSMCLAWASIAAMAPNGISLAASNCTITLPASAPAGAAVAWEHLRGCRTPVPLPLRLFELSAPLPAMLTYLCTRYVAEGAPSDVVRFVQDHERIKIFYVVGRLGGQSGCCDLA